MLMGVNSFFLSSVKGFYVSFSVSCSHTHAHTHNHCFSVGMCKHSIYFEPMRNCHLKTSTRCSQRLVLMTACSAESTPPAIDHHGNHTSLTMANCHNDTHPTQRPPFWGGDSNHMARCENGYEAALQKRTTYPGFFFFTNALWQQPTGALSAFVSPGNLYYRPLAAQRGRAGFRLRCLGDIRLVCFLF